MRVLRLVQVERYYENIQEICFKPTGVIDPLPDTLVWLPPLSATPPGYEPYMVQMALVGNSGTAGKKRWSVCYTCREEFPLAEMSIVNGRAYCQENKCAQEARS